MKLVSAEHLKLSCVFMFGVLLISCHEPQKLECTNSRGFAEGLFQQTWFTQPERKVEYIAAVFGDKTGEIRLPGKTISGDYCIEDKTIFLENEGFSGGLYVIEILSIDAENMVLELSDGTQLNFYNPYPDLTQGIDLEPKSFNN